MAAGYWSKCHDTAHDSIKVGGKPGRVLYLNGDGGGPIFQLDGLNF